MTQLLHNLGDDLRRLPSKTTAMTLGVGGAATIGARNSDVSVAFWAHESGSAAYTEIGQVLGDAWIQGGAAIFTYGVGKLHHNAQVTHVGSDLIRVQALNAVVTTSLKLAAGRERPTGGNRAFPSGHASAVFASAAVLQSHYGWKTGVPAYAFAGFIGWTRVRDRSHWLSDIVFGSTLGIIAGQTVTAGHKPRTWAVVPATTPGGAAVYLVRIR